MTRIQLFVTCLVDSFHPHVGEAMVDILRRLGIGVDFAPDQTCCGQPSFSAGLHSDARSVAQHIIQVFEKTTGDIVMPSGSCAHMITIHGYLELFRDDSAWLARAQSLEGRVYEFTEYLVDKLGVTDVSAHWTAYSPTIPPAMPCARCGSTTSRVPCSPPLSAVPAPAAAMPGG